MHTPRTITQIIDQVARQSIGKDWGLYATLLERWTEIVGADYAALTTPVKISFPHQPNERLRQNGVLTLRLPKGLAMEFSFKSEAIRQRINGAFGFEMIARIVFEPVFSISQKQKTEPKTISAESLSEIKSSTKSIEDNELRDALQSFGEAIVVSDRQ
jgi:hypothetical protein